MNGPLTWVARYKNEARELSERQLRTLITKNKLRGRKRTTKHGHVHEIAGATETFAKLRV
jgi:hypothetical protein